MLKKLLLISFLMFLLMNSQSQTVYQHIGNYELYFFLDELANEKIIYINSAVKPYSRKFIAKKLEEAQTKEDQLNNRQKAQLRFYLKDFNKELKKDKNFDKRFDLLYYKDSLFSITVNPVAGIQYFINDSGTVYHRWNGAEAFGYIGKHLGLYANLRDNLETTPLSAESYLNKRTGATFKGGSTGIKNSVEYSEMRGGITYNWDWGTIGLIKDHFSWGDNYNGANIFSGKTPSFAHIKLNLKPVAWFELNYVHGWLVSDVVDSSRSYFDDDSTFRTVMHNKYVASNIFTFKPWKTLSISLGNSIIYSDMNAHPAYLNPVMFYKSVDHTYNSTNNFSGQNAQMFGNISFRGIKHIHLYSTLFFDELNIGNMWNNEEHTNWFSLKGGIHISNLIPNTFLTFEYTRTNPMVYKHFVTTTTFASNSYNMGHYLRDNSQEVFLQVKFHPIKNLFTSLSYTNAEKGTDYPYGRGTNVRGLPFLENEIWHNEKIECTINYQIINDGYVGLKYINSNYSGDVLYHPEFFNGKLNTLSAWINYGF